MRMLSTVQHFDVPLLLVSLTLSSAASTVQPFRRSRIQKCVSGATFVRQPRADLHRASWRSTTRRVQRPWRIFHQGDVPAAANSSSTSPCTLIREEWHHRKEFVMSISYQWYVGFLSIQRSPIDRAFRKAEVRSPIWWSEPAHRPSTRFGPKHVVSSSHAHCE